MPLPDPDALGIPSDQYEIRYDVAGQEAGPFGLQPVQVHEAGRIPTSALVGALSTALDLTEGQVAGHAVRTCYLAMLLADLLGLTDRQRTDLFYAALLKDAGCSSNAAAVASIFGGDDIVIKRRQSLVERSVVAYAIFTLRSLSDTEPLPTRVRRLVHIALEGRADRRVVEQTRCERGASIARKAGFSDAVAAAIMDLHEHWDGGGMPRGLRGQDIDPLARILAVCQTIDVFRTTRGESVAFEVVRRRRGTWFEPSIVDAALVIRADPTDLAVLDRADLPERLADREPEHAVQTVDSAGIDRIAGAFADVVDAKSPFTGAHSRRTAIIAETLAARLGLSGHDILEVRRAALLHDIGKLGVPNAILDKPAALTAAEMAVIREHPASTRRILAPIPTFEVVADIAASHHERIDGAGYFRGLPGHALPLSARIVAVADVFEALTADRPYRPGMSLEQAAATIERMAGDHLARDVVAAMLGLLDGRPADLPGTGAEESPTPRGASSAA